MANIDCIKITQKINRKKRVEKNETILTYLPI